MSENKNKIWGGRFEHNPSEILEKINSSIQFDKRLYKHDILASIAHTEMLQKQSIIKSNDANKIIAGLKKIQKEIDNNQFYFNPSHEDIHMNIELRLKEIIGEIAGKMHTARSRNDQVVTDLKLWLKDIIIELDNKIKLLQKTLISLSEKNYDIPLPGYTHMQTAQAITLGHYFLAYVEMLGRDRGRFKDCLIRLNECPLGSAALAGTSYPIDRKLTSQKLGFKNPTFNSIDSVSDRDFVLEFLSSASICSVHLSRFAEEMILWSNQQFNFIKLNEKFTTGSSIMPQKRNPDAAELIRGKTGRIIGSLVGLLNVIKALPLAYSKDLQEDKEGLFDSVDTILLLITVSTEMIKEMEINSKNMEEALNKGFPTATDIADWLVDNIKIPFREAHSISGKIVKLAEKKNCRLDELNIEEIQSIDKRINKEVYNYLSIKSSLKLKRSFGGTSPIEVKKQIKLAKKRFLNK